MNEKVAVDTAFNLLNVQISKKAPEAPSETAKEVKAEPINKGETPDEAKPSEEAKPTNSENK